MAVTTLWLPSPRRWPRVLPQPVRLALGRADACDATAPAVVAAALGLAEGPWPAAALSRQEDAPGDGNWVRADPAWIRPDINGARLLAVGDMLPMSPDDHAAFVPALQAVFAEEGLAFDAPVPARWYVRAPDGAALPRFPSPGDALGGDVFDHPTVGDDARRWRRVANEMQVLLHQHPRNEIRRAQGLPPVNALWFWGEGALPAPQPHAAGIPTLFSDDAVLRGAARHANVAVATVPARWPATIEPGSAFDLRGVAPDALADDWLQPALEWIRREGKPMHWLHDEGPGFTLDARQRWRVWRHALGTPG